MPPGDNVSQAISNNIPSLYQLFLLGTLLYRAARLGAK